MNINFHFSPSSKIEGAAPLHQDKWYSSSKSNGTPKSRVHLFDDYAVPAEKNRYALAGEETATPNLKWFERGRYVLVTDPDGKSNCFFNLFSNNTNFFLWKTSD